MYTPLPWIGSTMNAATSPLMSSRSSAPRSLNGISVVSGTRRPNPSRKCGLPVTASEPIVSPWYDRSQYTMRCRPVAARANFIAASLASVPAEQKNTFRSGLFAPPGASASNSLASRPDTRKAPMPKRLGRSRSMACRRASRTTGWLRPVLKTA